VLLPVSYGFLIVYVTEAVLPPSLDSKQWEGEGYRGETPTSGIWVPDPEAALTF
jgi:hypothetical protein